jgi:hypothetical protein
MRFQVTLRPYQQSRRAPIAPAARLQRLPQTTSTKSSFRNTMSNPLEDHQNHHLHLDNQRCRAPRDSTYDGNFDPQDVPQNLFETAICMRCLKI